MYTPAAFAVHDAATMHDFIDAHPLGALVTMERETGLLATHLPLLLERGRGAHGVLTGHVARANPHAASTAAEAMVIFTGPDAYVAPEWYAAKREHGRVVPTWNYVAVHACGPLRLVDDAAWIRDHLEALTARHEGGRAHPWGIADAPADYVERMMRDVVGIEIEVARLEGEWKMSQNRSAADIDGVVAGLGASAEPRERAVAALVEARRPASKRREG